MGTIENSEKQLRHSWLMVSLVNSTASVTGGSAVEFAVSIVKTAAFVVKFAAPVVYSNAGASVVFVAGELNLALQYCGRRAPSGEIFEFRKRKR